ncbi:MAG: zeta toxin family protein [Bacteroidota bacterium]
MKKLHIVAGPNGAGKTTLSYTVLPEILDCKEFVNADEIARGISPFNPEKVAIKSGKLMLLRVKELLNMGESFAVETTLSSRAYTQLITLAIRHNYEVNLLFIALESVDLAIKRVDTRVQEGGHGIPIDTIKRRYFRGLINFFEIYSLIVSRWLLVDNSEKRIQLIGRGFNDQIEVIDKKKWINLKNKSHG